MTVDLEEESYICYAFWVPYEVYIEEWIELRKTEMEENNGIYIYFMRDPIGITYM